MTKRYQLLEGIASEIERLSADSNIFVGIDGVDGVGKTCFAEELAAQLTSTTIIRASIDDFHNPRRIRYEKGKDSPVGYFEDSFDYAVLKQLLLDPLKDRGSGAVYQTKYFDHRLDRKASTSSEIAPAKYILVFEGIFLHRPELAGYWDYSIFLDAPREVTIKRCIDREGAIGISSNPDDPIHRRYVLGQKMYLDAHNPKLLATKVVNNAIVEDPYVVA